jgi:hypothetical protein
MKILFTLLALVTGGLFTTALAQSQNAWPQKATAQDGTSIKMYEWQTESYSSNTLKARAAISIIEDGKTDPVFGVAWLTAELQNNGNGYSVQSVRVTTVKLPGEQTQETINGIQSALEDAIPRWIISFSKEELGSSVQQAEQESKLSKSINNAPPEILYTQQPSVLVSIDGTPKLQMNEEWGLETVINSPFTIIKNKDGNFYLYGGKHWYSAKSATGPYSYVPQAPQNLTAIESAINESYKNNNNTEEEKNDYTISSIVVTTKPAELIQTEGEARFGAVEGTSLLYVRNTDDDIFMDVSSQSYYVLLSGRWYKSKTLGGQWQFVGADQLPADFARIPESSEKADVLTSVAGTSAAREALEDAQVPQTAKVDRNSASVDVIYDGDPQFEEIDGTSMQYAVNSPFSVIRYRNRYYAVDNGVWFVSQSARGPWIVAVERPYEIALIPPRYPVYHVKYVYIYDVMPDYVYMGYTPGYLNTYIYGPTIVYGTGYYYRPWFGRYYYPRPCTWGYNMRYSPWIGWGFGINVNFGWFNVGIGNRYWGYSRCGWWGPSAYRPYYYNRGGFYGGRNRFYGGRPNVYVNNRTYNNNVYNNRRGIVTRNNYRPDDRRGGWANNNNYNNNRGTNRDRIQRGYENRNYNNNNRPETNRNFSDRNRNGGFNNDNRQNRENNGRISDRPNRQYNPQQRNYEQPDRNRERIFNDNRGNGNQRREMDRPSRQYQPQRENGGGRQFGGRAEGGSRNNEINRGNGGGNNNRSFERSNGGSRNNGGGQGNNSGRSVERPRRGG